ASLIFILRALPLNVEVLLAVQHLALISLSTLTTTTIKVFHRPCAALIEVFLFALHLAVILLKSHVQISNGLFRCFCCRKTLLTNTRSGVRRAHCGLPLTDRLSYLRRPVQELRLESTLLAVKFLCGSCSISTWPFNVLRQSGVVQNIVLLKIATRRLARSPALLLNCLPLQVRVVGTKFSIGKNLGFTSVFCVFSESSNSGEVLIAEESPGCN